MWEGGHQRAGVHMSPLKLACACEKGGSLCLPPASCTNTISAAANAARRPLLFSASVQAG